MSTPLAVTVKVPFDADVLPASAGVPMSPAAQGLGTAANAREAPQSAMSAMSHDTRMTSNRRQIGMWNTRWKDAARGAGVIGVWLPGGSARQLPVSVSGRFPRRFRTMRWMSCPKNQSPGGDEIDRRSDGFVFRRRWNERRVPSAIGNP